MTLDTLAIRDCKAHLAHLVGRVHLVSPESPEEMVTRSAVRPVWMAYPACRATLACPVWWVRKEKRADPESAFA